MDSSKYDLRVNPVYQVDFSATSKGKRLAATKRRVRFSFGFSNADAIEQGVKGIHCRGEEHEVTLAWSLTSGKRVVLADEEEVHFSQGKRTEMRFECSWTMNGNHVVKLVAHAAPAVLNKPGFRQFELFLDGMSFFDMPKIYELGVVSGSEILSRGARNQMAFAAGPAESYNDSYGRSYCPEEQSQLVPPVPDYKCGYHADRTRSAQDVRLPPHPEPRRTESMPLDIFSEPMRVQDYLTPAPVALIDQAPAVTPMDEFAPVAPPPATYNDLSSHILSAYGAPPAPAAPAFPALAYESHTHHTPVETIAAPQYCEQAPAETGAAPQYSFLAAPGSPTNISSLSPSGSAEYLQQDFSQGSPTSVRQVSDLEKAMQSLVNFDDISEPAISPMKLTMVKEREEKIKNNGKSRPLPPATPAWNVGPQACLGDIQANATPRAAPSNEVMRMHAFNPAAGQAGMLVVYGASPTEAPPIQHGFGYHAYGRAF
mmetsp:Transcript_5592/g.9250  ORF Transcript_5592/g.9250 Transcript_5592/m.9250 type:complete len:484 (-) Transcript_5592:529-1980(-)